MEQNLKQRSTKATKPTERTAYRLPEVAEKVGVCRRFLELEIQRGHLRCLRITSRCVRILPRDLDAWLESRRV